MLTCHSAILGASSYAGNKPGFETVSSLSKTGHMGTVGRTGPYHPSLSLRPSWTVQYSPYSHRRLQHDASCLGYVWPAPGGLTGLAANASERLWGGGILSRHWQLYYV
jgi:hypothetical protein